MKKYIMGLDAGTTSVRTVIFDVKKNEIIAVERQKFKQYFPKNGWVEHDANEIWFAISKTIKDCLNKNNINPKDIYCIGITNQRESVVAWDRRTGESICPSIVWQCRRTADYCSKMRESLVRDIKKRTGLKVDAYFSATKMKWILEHDRNAQKLLSSGNLCLGTIDSYLVYRLSNCTSFVTDTSNASRTMLYNITDLKWDTKLIKEFGIPIETLAKVVDNGKVIATANILGVQIPIASILGDQQSSLFGQGCFDIGQAKNTYGTGCFILANIGNNHIPNDKLLTTIAWTINGKTTYALEGSVFNAGSAMDWAIENMSWAISSKESSMVASSVPDTNDVYIVPAFTGIGAPYWDQYARGIITGISRGTTKAHLMRATLESMAYNTCDILDCMSKKGIKIKEITVDGGVSKNDFLMQFQSDMAKINVTRLNTTESTVLGCIYMAGLSIGIYNSLDEIKSKIVRAQTFIPSMPNSVRNSKLKGWHNAVQKTLYKNED